MTNRQPQVPERIEEPLRDALDERPHFAVIDDHEIQVGERPELPASVAAEGDQYDRPGDGAFLLRIVHGQAEERREKTIHEGRVGLHRLLA